MTISEKYDFDEKEYFYYSSDIGSSELLIGEHKDSIKIIKESGQWLFYNGIYWENDAYSDVIKLVKDVKSKIYKSIKNTNDKKVTLLYETGRKSLSKSKIHNCIELAKHQKEIQVSLSELNSNKNFFNCLNGTVNLETGDLLEHKRSDLITNVANFNYDPNAKCPKWEEFIFDCTNENQELIEYYQKQVGYTLSGNTNEQCFFILFGTGANGKTTFMETIKLLAGTYAKFVPPELFIKSYKRNVEKDVATIISKRLVYVSEIDQDKVLNEAFLKRLTGNDTVKAEINKNCYELQLEAKFYVVTNNKPKIKERMDAMWRRIHIIPFMHKVKKQNKNLQQELKNELPGIFNWALKGFQLFEKEGLEIPLSIKKAVKIYQTDMDVYKDFIESRCEINPEYSIIKHSLYQVHEWWAEDQGVKALSKHMLTKYLKEYGITEKRTSNCRYYVGISATYIANKQAYKPDKTS